MTTVEFRTDAMSGVLARNWWAVALRGVAAILFGLVALFATGPTLLSLVLVFAAVMLADGVFNIVAAVRSAHRHERWGTLILLGVTSLIAAAIAIFAPGLTVIAFVYLMAAWAVVCGAFSIAAAVRLRHDHGRWWLGLTGALSIAAGVLLGIEPLIGAIVLAWWLGVYALVFGASLLVLAFRLRERRHAAAHGATPHPA
jgi:uncharacterized membrane protein HdeD (DUF308 family)